MKNHLPTSFCQRSLRMTPNLNLCIKQGFEPVPQPVCTKVLFKDLNPGIAMAIVRFKFSRKLYFCFESVIRQKFNFSAFSEMAQNFWFWLHWMKRNYVFVLVDDKVSKFKSIQNWNWKFLLNFLEIAIKVIHFMYYLI